MMIDAPEIVVTGRALEQPVAERPLAVTVIRREELERAAVTNLEQVLQSAAGVQLFRRSDARSANPTSQGITLRALGGNASSRALLVLDGVPQTDPFGGWINWPAYDALALNEVRITRGGGSVAHGPGALAGTIELASLLQDGVAAGIEAGSRGSVEARAIAGGRLADGQLSLSVRAARGDGFIPTVAQDRGAADRRAPYENASMRLRWVQPIGAETELQTSVSGFADARKRGLAFSDNESRGGDLSARLVSRGRWQWTALAYAQWREFESSFAATDPDRSAARRTSLQYDVPGRAFGASLEVRPPLPVPGQLRVGADARWMRGASHELGSYVAGVATRDRQSGGRAGHVGLFAEGSWERGILLVSAGARIDRWEIARGFNREQVAGSWTVLRDQRFGERSGWLPTGRVGAEVTVAPKVTLRGAGYTGWRLPTINELFRPFRLGQDVTGANSGLRPERLAGAEAGIRARLDWLNLDLTAFANRLQDPIANVTVGAGPGVFPDFGFVPAGGIARQRQNLTAISARGLEVSASVGLGPWSAMLSGSLTRARVRADGAATALNGLRPAQTPSRAIAMGFGWAEGSTAANIQVRYVGPQYEDDLNRQLLPNALTVDLFGSLPLSTHWQLVARAENLFDEEVIAGISGLGVRERATPRTLWLGLRYRGSR